MRGSHLVAVLLPIVLLSTLGTCSRAKPPTALPASPTPAPTAQATYSQPSESPAPTETPQAVAPPVEIRILASDPKTGKPTMKVAYVPESETGQAAKPNGLSWSPDGQYLACWWNDRVWYSQAGTQTWQSLPVQSSREQGCWIYWLHGGRKVVLDGVKSARGSAVFLVDVTSGIGKPILDEEDVKQRVGEITHRAHYGVDVPSSGRMFRVEVGATGDGVLDSFFDAEGHHIQSLDTMFHPPEGYGASETAWSYDGTKALMRPYHPLAHDVLLLDAVTTKIKHEWFRDYPFFATWSPNGRFIALITVKHAEDAGCACGWGGTFALYEVATGKVTRYPALGTIGEMIWSPDGLSIAMDKDGGEDAKPGYLFSVKSRKATPLPKALAKKGEMYSMSGWSPDGRYLATESDTDRLLDTKEWKIIVPKKGDRWLPRDAKEGDSVWPLERDPYEQPVPVGSGWVHLGEPTPFEETREVGSPEKQREMSLLYFGRFGRGQPSLIGQAYRVRVRAWWPEPEPSPYNGGHEWGLPG